MQELECLAKRVGDYVAQPFVAGREYSVDVLCDWDGRPLCVVPRERLRVRAGEVCIPKRLIAIRSEGADPNEIDDGMDAIGVFLGFMLKQG